MFTINTGTLSALTGLTAAKIDTWVNCRIIKPVANAHAGKGRYREWDFMSLLALTFGLNHGKKPGGWQIAPHLIEGWQSLVAHHLSRLSEADIVQAIKEGRVIAAPLNGVKLIEPPKNALVPAHLDLGLVYEQVREKWDQMEEAMRSEEEETEMGV